MSASESRSYRDMSFAERVNYFPFDIDENANSVEREYLLGGGGTGSSSSSSGSASYSQLSPKPLRSRHKAPEDLQPMKRDWNVEVVFYANLCVFLLSATLMGICIYEARTDYGDPVLMVGSLVSGLAMLNALLGVFGNTRRDSTGITALYVNHTGSFISMLLMVLLAVATLVHWDIGGAPIYDVFNRQDSIAVQFRYMIWGGALAVSLCCVASMFGTLGREWPDEDALFKGTLRASLFVIMLVGGSLVAVGTMVWVNGEVREAIHRVWLLGSIIAGGFFFLVGFISFRISSVRTLNWFMIWVPLVALAVTFFSVANAVASEPERINSRRTNLLLSGLIGLWGQINTCIAIASASRWRWYLANKDLLPEYNQ